MKREKPLRDDGSRVDGRAHGDPREVSIELAPQRNPEGSILYRCGGTTVLISASVEKKVPEWMAGKGKGWVTAEYAMHPRANPERQRRDGRKGTIDGRTQEIQRLVARSLRAAVDMEKLGERMITIDCDVLDADGGTRTAAITGGFVAMALAIAKLKREGLVGVGVLREPIAAISAGLVSDTPLLDLCYIEDSAAEVDLNVVATGRGDLVEVQGTAEGAPVPKDRFDALITLGLEGTKRLAQIQRDALERAGVPAGSLFP